MLLRSCSRKCFWASLSRVENRFSNRRYRSIVRVNVPLQQYKCIKICNQNITHFSEHLFSKQNRSISGPLDAITFEEVCDDTLDSLTDYFEELIEGTSHLDSTDVTYGDGVLTVQFGKPYGTYVINRQTPNQQIWLSSPTSGPKRYDFDRGHWIYHHDGVSLHQLLTKEIANIVKHSVDFSQCSYSGSKNISE